LLVIERRIELLATRNYRSVEAWMVSSLDNRGIRKTLDEVPESLLHSFPSDRLFHIEPVTGCTNYATIRVYHSFLLVATLSMMTQSAELFIRLLPESVVVR